MNRMTLSSNTSICLSEVLKDEALIETIMSSVPLKISPPILFQTNTRVYHYERYTDYLIGIFNCVLWERCFKHDGL